VIRDYEVKGNMTNTGPEKHQPNNEEDLPVVLLHGTSGQSEDWSQVIRLNYAEPVAGTDSANAPRVSDFAVRVVAAAEAGGMHRFDLVGFSLGAAVSPQVLPLPNMRSMQ
jgi:pimeloyl-ACP methyl ester carboxylesterase